MPIVVSVGWCLDAPLARLPVLVVQTISHSIHFRSVTQQVSVVGICLKIFEGHEEQTCSDNHPLPDLLVWSSESVTSLHKVDEVADVVSHLRSGGGSAVFVVDHAVLELSGHTNDHVVEVWVEGFALRDIHAIWWLEVVARHDVVDVVDASWSHSDLAEVCGPDTSVGILCLILTVVRRIHPIVNVPISLIPFLEVVLLEVLVGWMDLEVLGNPCGQLKLLVSLVQQVIVLLGVHAMAVAAILGENLETYVKKPVPRRTLPLSYVPMKVY